jgi:hypothetical protein
LNHHHAISSCFGRRRCNRIIRCLSSSTRSAPKATDVIRIYNTKLHNLKVVSDLPVRDVDSIFIAEDRRDPTGRAFSLVYELEAPDSQINHIKTVSFQGLRWVLCCSSMSLYYPLGRPATSQIQKQGCQGLLEIQRTIL